MGFIGQPLNAGNLSVDVFTGNGSTTVFALTYSVGSSESVAIYLDGVKQAVSTYTASGTTLTFTTAPPNGVGIEVVFLALPISLPTPGDSTVTSAKIVDGAIVNDDINASAGIVRTKLATPGAWILIGTNVASTTAALTQTGLDSTYDTYAVVISDLVPAADGETLRMTVGDSGGLDVGASDYSYHNNRTTHASGTYAGVATATNANCTLSGACGNAAGEGYGGILYIHRPGDGTMQPTFSWHGTSVTDTTVGLYGAGSGKRNAVIALDRVSIFFNSGNIATGRMSVFGISHT